MIFLHFLRTALHLAAATGHLRIIDLLLQRDGSAALRMQDKDGNTPIHKVHMYYVICILVCVYMYICTHVCMYMYVCMHMYAVC